MGGLLRLADGGKQSQIRKGSCVELGALARQLHPEAKSQILFVFFRYECFEGTFFLLSFFGTLAATIS
jgi:hypothetical protein